MCRNTRQIIGYVVVERNAASCESHYENIPQIYKKCNIYTYDYELYKSVISASKNMGSKYK